MLWLRRYKNINQGSNCPRAPEHEYSSSVSRLGGLVTDQRCSRLLLDRSVQSGASPQPPKPSFDPPVWIRIKRDNKVKTFR